MMPKIKQDMVIETEDGNRCLVLSENRVIFWDISEGYTYGSELPNKWSDSGDIKKVFKPALPEISETLAGKDFNLIWQCDDKKQQLIDKAEELKQKAEELLEQAEEL